MRVIEILTAISDGLRSDGFEGGEPVHEYACYFTAEDVQASLFRSTASNPIPIRLRDDRSDPDLPIVLTRAHQHYTHGDDDPDWYFEGWVLPPRYDPDDDQELVRVRMYVSSGFEDIVLWQFIPNEPTDEMIALEV